MNKNYYQRTLKQIKLPHYKTILAQKNGDANTTIFIKAKGALFSNQRFKNPCLVF